MHFQGDQLVTEVFGTSASIIDLGEMLAWLGATLQSSPNPLHLAYCMPKISHVLEQPKAAQGSHYRISFEIEEIEEIEDLLPTATSNGRCWHHLFNNPVIIRGYPITPKVRSGSGIEIPLNIMAALVGSRKVDEFEGRNFIKGFSKMLVPAQKDGDIVYWHLYHSESGKRIPFWHPTTSHAAYINNLQLEGCRHILGWTLEAEFCAGMSY